MSGLTEIIGEGVGIVMTYGDGVLNVAGCDGEGCATVFDLYGHTVAQTSVSGGSATIPPLGAGIYVASYTGIDGVATNQKIIVK